MLSNYLNRYPEVNKQLSVFETALKRRRINGNIQFYSCTIATLELLKYIFNNSTFNNLYELKSILLELDLRLNKASPDELSVRILISRIYMMLRDASTTNTINTHNNNSSTSTNTNNSIFNFDDWRQQITQIVDNDNNNNNNNDGEHIFDLHNESFDVDPSAVTIQKEVMDTMISFISEIYEDYEMSAIKDAFTDTINNNDNKTMNISNNIIVEDNDTILVYGYNFLIQHVLVQVAKTRKNLKVLVCENENGLKLAQHLTSSSSNNNNYSRKIDVSLISEASIYACMNKISKVLIAPNIICCDGNAIALAGNDTVVNAAKMHKIPTISIVPSSSLAPFTSKSNQIQRLLQQLLPPSQVASYKDKRQEIDIQAFAYTCINANDISYVVSSNGCFYPSEAKDFISTELFSQE